jgi:hypothetical protein
MTEAEWLACTDPTPMLDFLRGKATDRKLRLFACGCCRRIWHRLSAEPSQAAVEAAERYADDLVNPDEVMSHFCDCEERLVEGDRYAPHDFAVYFAVIPAIAENEHGSGLFPPAAAADGAVRTLDDASAAVAERMVQCDLLRCIFGNPLHTPPAINPTWLAWNDSTVRRIAQAIYDERTFDRMPILVDALEDAGCTDRDILDHCRQPGEHVRGCWVVDLLLGKS